MLNEYDQAMDCTNCASETPLIRKLHTKALECEDNCNVEQDETCDTMVCPECGDTIEGGMEI